MEPGLTLKPQTGNKLAEPPSPAPNQPMLCTLASPLTSSVIPLNLSALAMAFKVVSKSVNVFSWESTVVFTEQLPDCFIPSHSLRLAPALAQTHQHPSPPRLCLCAHPVLPM